MRVTFRTPAPAGMCFGPEVFAGMVGRQVPLSGLGLTGPAIGIVLAVQVTDDHQAADVTVELPDDAPGLAITIGLED